MHCYYFEYSDNRPHLYCYTYNVSADMSFGFIQVFMFSPKKLPYELG